MNADAPLSAISKSASHHRAAHRRRVPFRRDSSGIAGAFAQCPDTAFVRSVPGQPHAVRRNGVGTFYLAA
jgi:hypothetical protein